MRMWKISTSTDQIGQVSKECRFGMEIPDKWKKNCESNNHGIYSQNSKNNTKLEQTIINIVMTIRNQNICKQ